MNFDPYQPLAASLRQGDKLNRWLLLHPRQRIVQLLKGQRVLDVGCGTGNLAALLLAAGCQVVGVDSSATMLSHARRKGLSASFEQLDAGSLPYDRQFDSAVISIALHEMSPLVRLKAWESMQRAVIPAGRLIALDYAVPLRKHILARIVSDFIARDERGFLYIYPTHYRNFLEFIANGGILAWLQEQNQTIEADYRFWAGNVAVIVVRQGGLAGNYPPAIS